MGHIEKRADRPLPWRARIITPDGDRLSRSFQTRREADQWLAQQEHEQNTGQWVDPRDGATLLGDWWTTWWPTVANLRESTRRRDEQFYGAYIAPHLGARPLADIDRLTVSGWVSQLSQAGLAPATIHKAHQILAKMLREAVASRLIAVDPTVNPNLPTVEHAEMRFLTPSEVEVLADAIDQRWRALVVLGCWGGLRIGEMLGLQVANVDQLHRRVHVQQTLYESAGKLLYQPTKTRAGRRHVPLPRFVADELAAHIAGRPADGLVFPAAEGGPVRLSLFRRRIWRKAVTAAGLDPLRIHDMRHTAVSFWIAAGAQPIEIARRAGHTSVSVVLDRYGHLLPEQDTRLNSALEQLAGRNASTVDPTPGRRVKRPG